MHAIDQFMVVLNWVLLFAFLMGWPSRDPEYVTAVTIRHARARRLSCTLLTVLSIGMTGCGNLYLAVYEGNNDTSIISNEWREVSALQSCVRAGLEAQGRTGQYRIRVYTSVRETSPASSSRHMTDHGVSFVLTKGQYAESLVTTVSGGVVAVDDVFNRRQEISEHFQPGTPEYFRICAGLTDTVIKFEPRQAK